MLEYLRKSDGILTKSSVGQTLLEIHHLGEQVTMGRRELGVSANLNYNNLCVLGCVRSFHSRL